MIKTERETVERLLNMAMTHSDLVCDSLESQEYDVASSHAQDLKQVLYVLLDYVQHFTDNETMDKKIECLEEDDKFNYMMLDRLKQDCEYFLGNGNGYEKHLWAGNVEDQIAEMRKIYDKLPEKPQWLSLEDIDKYEKDMLAKRDSKDESLNEEEAFNIGQWLKDNGVTDEYAPKEGPKYDYVVVVYGGFDETPLIRYQRDFDNKDQATTIYHELEDTFRLKHKIFDNNTGEFIAQEDCSSMAVIKCGPHDDKEVISFKSLLYYEDGKTNASYYNEDYRQIVNYLIDNCNL